MATNYARASYQEVYDLGTRKNKVSIVGIHTPQGNAPATRLEGFFSAFRKFKYSGCTVTIVPAATLPADPLQVGFEAGENIVDMRDMLNPILFHGTHGESLTSALNVIYKDQDHTYGNESTSGTTYPAPALTADEVDFDQSAIQGQYYSALTDRTWKKFGIQSTIRLPNMRPLVWKTATQHPILPTNAKNYGELGSDGSTIGRVFVPELTMNESGLDSNGYHDMQFMSNGVSPLGWLPCNQFFSVGGTAQVGPGPKIVLPKIFMGILMFPPSYLQELYFRMVVTHYFEFKEFRGTSLSSDYPFFSGGYGYNKWFTGTASNSASNSDSDPTMAVDDVSNQSSLDLTESDARLVSDGVF